jgi:ATP-binding cassette subfamily B protein AbcA/BmrA
VEKKGVYLSEAQKQHLSISRALIKDADVLIFDEPSSTLDPLAERSILQSLAQELTGNVFLVAAHRLSMLKIADRRLVLNKGKVTGFGTHTDLLESNDYFRSLFSSNLSDLQQFRPD